MRTPFPFLRLLISVTFLLGGSDLDCAHAAEREEDENTRAQRFKELYESAGRAYGSGDYTAAIPSLQAAYALQPLPPLLFNIGQAYRKLEMWTEARVYLELYRHVHLDMPRDRAASLDDLVIEAREKERLAHTPQVIEKTRLLYVAQEKPLPKWLRPLGVTAGVLGLGAVGVGGWMLGIHGTCPQDPVPPALACEQVYSTQAPGIGVLAAGGAAMIVGTVMFSLSFRKPARPVVQQTPPAQDFLPSLDQSAFAKGKPQTTDSTRGRVRAVLPAVMVSASAAKDEPPPAGTPPPEPSRSAVPLPTLEVPQSPRAAEPPPHGFRASGRRSHH